MNKNIVTVSWTTGFLTVMVIYTFAINHRIEVVAREQIANREETIAHKYSERINAVRVEVGLQPRVDIKTMEDLILAIEEISNTVSVNPDKLGK